MRFRAIYLFAPGAALLCGCSTLAVPVAVPCPVPQVYLNPCDDTAQQLSEKRSQELEVAARRYDEANAANDKSSAVKLLDEVHRKHYDSLSLGSRSCLARQDALSKMIQACNQNAEDLRPRLLRALGG
jgi:hypothetical protein